MSYEIDAQHTNHTWDLVPPAPYQNVIDTKWIFRIKQLPDGSLDKYNISQDWLHVDSVSSMKLILMKHSVHHKVNNNSSNSQSGCK